MRVLCVDDEPALLGLVMSMCEDLPQAPAVRGFTRARQALEWLDTHHADVALLDIDMPGMSGIELAREIKRTSPDTEVIFLTGYAEYALDAFELHASGYLLKPVNSERLREEIEHAVARRGGSTSRRVEIHTFGNFDVFVDGEPIAFARSQSKELLAYLVDRQGAAVTRRQAFAVLWEMGDYDRSKQKQLDVVVRTMRNALDKYGVGDLVEMRRGTLRVVPERVDCDFYRFLAGDERAIASYIGEYLSPYPWASSTEAYLTRMKERAR